MANPGSLGIWHTTTVDSVTERQKQTSYEPALATATGGKRTLAEAEEVPSKRPSFSIQATAISRRAPRLSASEVVHMKGDASDELQYTQRRALAATPSSTIDPLLDLAHRIYDLPEQLVRNFVALGIKEIYPWQKQCLLGPGLLAGEKNLVYSAPTGGGKSLIADVLMLKRVVEDPDAKALLVLPYVALVQEKVRWLRKVVQGISREALGQKVDRPQTSWIPRADKDTVRVVGFFGGGKIRATWADFDIGVCTIEKVGKYPTSVKLHEPGAVVF